MRDLVIKNGKQNDTINQEKIRGHGVLDKCSGKVHKDVYYMNLTKKDNLREFVEHEKGKKILNEFTVFGSLDKMRFKKINEIQQLLVVPNNLDLSNDKLPTDRPGNTLVQGFSMFTCGCKGQEMPHFCTYEQCSVNSCNSKGKNSILFQTNFLKKNVTTITLIKLDSWVVCGRFKENCYRCADAMQCEG